MIPDKGVTTPDDSLPDNFADLVDKEATMNTDQMHADIYRITHPHKYLDAAVSRNTMVAEMVTYFESIHTAAPTGATTLKQTMLLVQTHLNSYDVPNTPVESFDNADFGRDSDDDVQSVTVPESVLEAFPAMYDAE